MQYTDDEGGVGSKCFFPNVQKLFALPFGIKNIDEKEWANMY